MQTFCSSSDDSLKLGSKRCDLSIGILFRMELGKPLLVRCFCEYEEIMAARASMLKKLLPKYCKNELILIVERLYNCLRPCKTHSACTSVKVACIPALVLRVWHVSHIALLWLIFNPNDSNTKTNRQLKIIQDIKP